MVNKGISISPSDFTGELQVLDLTSRKVVSAIHKKSLDEFLTSYQSPPKDTDGYLDVRYLPNAWSSAIRDISANHLFLYSFCLASAEGNVKKLMEVRQQANELCMEAGNEPGFLWLDMRPKFLSTLSTTQNRRKFPSWNSDVRGWMASLAHNCCITSRTLLIIYSSKAVLNSSCDLKGVRDSLEREVANWDGWILGEIDAIRRIFSLV